jgi:predicted transcriptional regulator
VKSSPTQDLGKRERQIMDAVYRLRRATVAEVLVHLPAPPSYSAVRAMLRILENKGHLRHEQDGPRYVYVPTMPQAQARRSMLRHVVRTFFDGSTEQAVASLLENADTRLSEAELDRLSSLIQQARKQGR